MLLLLLQLQQRHVTGGVPGVDDAQCSGSAVMPGFIQGPLQLADVQTPALLLIQVVVDLHCPEFGQRSRVERILRNGDHDACACCAFAARKQLQNCLNVERTNVVCEFYLNLMFHLKYNVSVGLHNKLRGQKYKLVNWTTSFRVNFLFFFFYTLVKAKSSTFLRTLRDTVIVMITD